METAAGQDQAPGEQPLKPKWFTKWWWLGIMLVFILPPALLTLVSYWAGLLFGIVTGVVVIYLIERLQRSNRVTHLQTIRNRAIFASIGEGLLVVNEYGNIVEANPAALKLLGFSWPELKDKWFPKAIKAVDSQGQEIAVTERPILKALETGQPVTQHAQYITKDGSTLPVFVAAAPFLVNDQPVGAINIFHDRSEEMRLEQVKDEFVSLASHQLRTPLTSIRLFTEMILGGQVGPLKHMQKDYLEKVELSTKRMISLVADILNVSRVEMGRLRIEPVPTDLWDLINSRVEEIKPVAHKKNVKITLEPVDFKIPLLPLDPILFGQVVHNLLSNALRYTKAGTGQVNIRLSQNPHAYTLEVTDNGIGIPKEVQSRIFERFFRADNAISVEGEGTGLGLYLIKMIMSASGGKIRFESVEGKGTSFYVTIPKSGMKPHTGDKGLG